MTLEPFDAIVIGGGIDLSAVDEGGEAIQERGVVPSQPGLSFVGLFFLHALSSSLIGGVGRDARYIADRVAVRAGAMDRRRAPRRAGGGVLADDR
jgi:hypothetical protein